MSAHALKRSLLPSRNVRLVPGESEIDAELAEPPDGAYPDPPVETAAQVLPFEQLSPENFERLCMRLARLEGTPTRTRLYGTPGQAQHGIDIYSRLPSGRYATYQCKRYTELKASDIGLAVSEFLDGKWAGRSERFVFCCATSTNRTDLEEEIEAQEHRLAARDPPIAWDVWDGEELSFRLIEHPDIVQLFFGPAWARRFLGEAGAAFGASTEIEAVLRQEQAEESDVADAYSPMTLRARLRKLHESDRSRYRTLTAQLGHPPDPLLIATAIATPPLWLRRADSATWDLLARIAEVRGEWRSASKAWERASEQADEPASLLVKAAIAAHVDQDEAEYTRLTSAAAAVDSREPRLVLDQLDVGRPPTEQLALLDTIRTGEVEVLGLVAARRAVAHLLMPDTLAARRDLAEVQRLIPESALIPGLEVSIAVQEGRLAVIGHQPLNRGALEEAARKAVVVRERLRASRRFSESTRMVMLEADAHALLGERARASAVLRSALPEERASQEQKVVLAEAAVGRALDPSLAMSILDGADESPAVLRLRFECLERIGTPVERQRAIVGLEKLVREGGPEAAVAAFLRLAATLGSKPTPWSEEAAILLRSRGYERMAVTAEVMYRVDREGWAAAEKLLRPYGDTPWALAAAMRASLHQRVSPEIAVRAAQAVLAIGPSHALRVDAGRAFRRARQFDNARQTLLGVARDPNAPDTVRGDAYDEAIRIVGKELNDWVSADRLHAEWVLVSPADVRMQQWAPTIASRKRIG